MICCFSKRFLFIKTRKTGGTSLEIDLSRHCGPGDIITPISAEDEITRLEAGLLAQNYSDWPALEGVYRTLTRCRWERPLYSYAHWERRYRRFYNHLSIEAVHERLPEGALDGFHTFTIERHPYEKVVSVAYFRMGRNRAPKDRDFSGILDAVIESKEYINYPLYTMEGRVAVARVIQHERLADDYREILRELGLPAPAALPRAKVRFRTSRQPAREVLSDAQKERIQRDARFEFETFGYPTD
jgi:hypothetical protein